MLNLFPSFYYPCSNPGFLTANWVYLLSNKFAASLQSIGFVGPGIALIGLTAAKSPLIASAWLTLAVGLKSFSHSGFLVNLQVGIPTKPWVKSEPSRDFSLSSNIFLFLLCFQEIAPQYSGVLHGTFIIYFIINLLYLIWVINLNIISPDCLTSRATLWQPSYLIKKWKKEKPFCVTSMITYLALSSLSVNSTSLFCTLEVVPTSFAFCALHYFNSFLLNNLIYP